MIRTFITPTQGKYNVALEFPEDYLGQELELIVFKKQEGLIAEKKLSKQNFLINTEAYVQKKMPKVLMNIPNKCVKNGAIFDR